MGVRVWPLNGDWKSFRPGELVLVRSIIDERDWSFFLYLTGQKEELRLLLTRGWSEKIKGCLFSGGMIEGVDRLPNKIEVLTPLSKSLLNSRSLFPLEHLLAVLLFPRDDFRPLIWELTIFDPKRVVNKDLPPLF